MNKFSHTLLSNILLVIICLFSIAACSGSDSSSSDNNNDGDDNGIDLSRFFFPESSRTLVYERYFCDNTDSTSCSLDYTKTETWEVDENIFIVEEVTAGDDDFSMDTITVEENTITVISVYMPQGQDLDPAEESEYSFERYQKADTVLNRDNDTEYMYFGPFSDASYDFFDETFQSDNLLITVSKNKNEVSEGSPQTYEMVIHFSGEGEGNYGYVYFYECSETIELSLEADFEGLCESAFTELLIDIDD